jgi:ABC-type uncharacterized transport system auxiliary subunit
MKSLALTLFAIATLCGCASSSKWKAEEFALSLPDAPPAMNAPTNIFALNRVSLSPLFQSRAFTYRMSESAYGHDPYASFSVAPEHALAVPIRAWMRQSGVFGRVVEPGSGLTPGVVAEVSVSQLYGDFRTPAKPVGRMEIRFVFYEVQDGIPGRVVLDKVCARETPLTRKTPAALVAAWDSDLREVMEEISAEYAKANSKER